MRLVDERLSTVTAHRNLHEAGMSSRNHRKVVDQVAAAGILQHAIDMQKARGTEVGSRVYAESAPGPTGNGADAPGQQTAGSRQQQRSQQNAISTQRKATVSPVNSDDTAGVAPAVPTGR